MGMGAVSAWPRRHQDVQLCINICACLTADTARSKTSKAAKRAICEAMWTACAVASLPGNDIG